LSVNRNDNHSSKDRWEGILGELLSEKWRKSQMMQPTLVELTPEQTALIPVYLDKWRQIALISEPIDLEQAKSAIENAYAILFAENNNIVASNLDIAISTHIYRLTIEIWDELKVILMSQLQRQLSHALLVSLTSIFLGKIRCQFIHLLPASKIIKRSPKNIMMPQKYDDFCLGYAWASQSCLIDFCISELHCMHQPLQWQAFRELVNHCGLILPTENGFTVCDRAYLKTILRLNDCLQQDLPATKKQLKSSQKYSLCLE
jgi:hypothetical protein